MRMAILAGVVLFSMQACAAQQTDCAAQGDPAAAEVYAARAAFNRAIVQKDIDAIRALLAEDVLLVTGTDGDIFNGRDTQLSVWQGDFEEAERAIYERASACVLMSSLVPIALETGKWRGVRTDDANDFAAGSYAAKWRKRNSLWRLEAEIFFTESCGGTFCPDAEGSE